MVNNLEQLTGNGTKQEPVNITTAYDQAVRLLSSAQENYEEGWYAVARSQLQDALSYAGTALNQLNIVNPILENNSNLLLLSSILLVALLLSNIYWYDRTRKTK